MRMFALLPAFALALAACTEGRSPAVVSLATHAEAPRCGSGALLDAPPGPALEAACTRDPACGCASLGHALLMASDGAVEARVLEVLDGACRRGVRSSCDDVAVVEELCVRGTARPSPACDVLMHEGRVGAAEMQGR